MKISPNSICISFREVSSSARTENYFVKLSSKKKLKILLYFDMNLTMRLTNVTKLVISNVRLRRKLAETPGRSKINLT